MRGQAVGKELFHVERADGRRRLLQDEVEDVVIETPPQLPGEPVQAPLDALVGAGLRTPF